ncbi:Chromosome-partitioning protein Spo0J [compost metagenome]
MTNQPTTRDASRPDFPAVVHTYTDALRILRERGASSPAEIANLTERVLSNVRRDLPKLAAAGVIIIADADNAPLIDITDKGLKWVAGQDVAEGLTDEPGSSQGAAEGGVIFLTHAQISADRANARRDWDSDEAKDELDALRQDILQNGLLQNLVVCRTRRDLETDKSYDARGIPRRFTLVGGERRWRAIGEAITDGDWEVDTPIPCRLLDTDDLGHRLAALAENLQRRNLNPIEKANAFEGLALAGLTNKEIADRVSSTPEHVQQHRRFLQLDADDQARMTLGRDDPRHLSVREARQKLAKKDDGPPAIELEPMARLAWIEITYAAYHTAEHTNLWSKVPVAVGASETSQGQRLVEIGAVEFGAERERHGALIGRFTVKRSYDANRIKLAHPFPDGIDELDTAEAGKTLRAEQISVLGDAAPVWAGDTPCYATPWLADIGDMDDEGQAIIDVRRAEEAQTAKDVEERQRQTAMRAQLWADARARHVKLLEASQAAPTAGEPAEVIAIATDIDRPFPWTAMPNGFIVAANGASVKQPHHYIAPTDQELAINQMIVVAANTSAGLVTPVAAATNSGAGELDEGAFVVAIADAISIDASVDQLDAVDTAGHLLDEYLIENGVEFGDEGFAWDRDAAQLIAEAHLNPEGDLEAADEDEVAS